MTKKAVVYIGEQGIRQLLALPEGIRAVAVAPNFIRMAIAVLVEGDSLEDVPEAGELPELTNSDGTRYEPPVLKTYQDGYREGYAAGSRDTW